MTRILMVTSEAAPFAKTGGLAEVLGSLPPALVRLGDRVAVVLPRYREIELAGERRVWQALAITIGPRTYSIAIDHVVRQGVDYYFLDCPPLYDRAGIYNEAGVDYPDNHIRFAVLNQAAIAVARYLFRTDVFHAHDWPAGLLPVYLRENFSGDPTFFGTRCVFTIHNLGYQGIFGGAAMSDLGLDPAVFRPDGLEFQGNANFLKGGIVWADAVNTVSPTYAREIQTPEFGFGLDTLLRANALKLSGILNGVDYDTWNPETDPHLPAHYSACDLSGKRACKLSLMQELGLAFRPEAPVIGIISRFAHQKGMELVVEAAPGLMSRGVAFAALGSGDRSLEDAFLGLADAYPDRFAVRIGYDEGLSHRIEAGADMFLMPSRYEPCGLNQIYSLRYGTVPVVRATGGLDDTVDDQTGFKFRDYSAAALAHTVAAALLEFQDPEAWKRRRLLGMAKDFSWDASAVQYQQLYTG